MEQVRPEWRLAFGDVVDEYEAARPDYPGELVKDVLTYAGGRPAMAVLDVGAGTGKASRVFAEHGVTLTCLEPDRRMADRLSEHPALREARVHGSDFETWPGPAGAFDLLVSAQAWHWVDPAVGWRRADEMLRPGGAVALFWHLFKVLDPDLRADLVAAHRVRGMTGLDARVMEEWVRVPSVDRSVWPADQLRERPEFTDVDYRAYTVQHTFTTPRFLQLLTTLSAYRMLEVPARDDLYDELSRVIHKYDASGCLQLSASTQLTMARTRLQTR
ncbi:class I SAM-dependent methyltransferase [Nonomuraea typhae]|uniref:Class I SAM-dependent methyltransferase n=1 Tax=Nonomuraea typhae TaxID=2603600 RepID=A0ABW7ZCJ2_9ACTN